MVVMPITFRSLVMAFFPLTTLPITVSVIVPVAVPARCHDNNIRRLGILWLRLDVYWCRRGHSDTHTNVDVRKGGRRHADAKTRNWGYCEQTTKCGIHSVLLTIGIGRSVQLLQREPQLPLVAVVTVVMMVVIAAAFGDDDAATQYAS
jgi:hypothetical protein